VVVSQSCCAGGWYVALAKTELRSGVERGAFAAPLPPRFPLLLQVLRTSLIARRLGARVLLAHHYTGGFILRHCFLSGRLERRVLRGFGRDESGYGDAVAGRCGRGGRGVLGGRHGGGAAGRRGGCGGAPAFSEHRGEVERAEGDGERMQWKFQPLNPFQTFGVRREGHGHRKCGMAAKLRSWWSNRFGHHHDHGFHHHHHGEEHRREHDHEHRFERDMEYHHMHHHRHLGWGLLRKIGRWFSGIPSFISDMPTLIVSDSCAHLMLIYVNICARREMSA
jgi:hypothetical protein